MENEPLFLVFLGAPGAGKGTQARLLSEKLRIPQISTGDIFRENLKKETKLGLLAKGYMEKGELVPDEVTVAMVRERLSRPDCARGAILDGFPRTIAQAEALDRILSERGASLTAVPYIKVSEEVLLARLSGRWICRKCGAVYHTLYNPPKVPGVCDVCGGELYQREDDKPEVAKNRLRVYFEQTAPLIEYYRGRGLLVEIDGEQSIERVQKELEAVVESHDCP